MNFFERYDKNIIEPFALKTISKSFSENYSKYFSPKDLDNFDYISEDGISALEITTVIPLNVMEAYKYEKLLNQGNKTPCTKTIADVKTTDDGSLVSYYGGSIHEIKINVSKAISKKNDKAKKRIINSKIKTADLCVCIEDGGLFEKKDFESFFSNLNETLFENIFFITSSHFISYNKNEGFIEHERKI